MKSRLVLVIVCYCLRLFWRLFQQTAGGIGSTDVLSDAEDRVEPGRDGL